MKIIFTNDIGVNLDSANLCAFNFLKVIIRMKCGM